MGGLCVTGQAANLYSRQAFTTTLKITSSHGDHAAFFRPFPHKT